VDALTNLDTQRRQHADFKDTFNEEVAADWEALIREWHMSYSGTNPYDNESEGKTYVSQTANITDLLMITLGKTLTEYRMKLAEEEEKDAENGTEQPHDISASSFLHMGFELEEKLYVSDLLMPLCHSCTLN
jgi:hypothetical protein